MLRRPALHWTRADDTLDCVDPRTLAERVEELVGPVLVRSPEAEYSIEARVARGKEGALRVEVRVLNAWGGKVGERSFEHTAGSCAGLTPAIAFVIAMTIDPNVAAHGLPPALVALLGEEAADDKLLRELDGAPPPAVEPHPAVAAVLEPAPAPPAKPAAVLQVRDPELDVAPPREPNHQLGALVRAAYRETARASLGLQLRYLLRVTRSSLAVGGYAQFGRQLGAHELGADHQLELTTLDLGLLGCAGRRVAARLRLAGCLGAEAAIAYGRGGGFTPNQLQVMATGAAVAQLTARLEVVEPFGVMVALNLRSALEQREFRYENADGVSVVVYRSPVLAGGIALGPTWEF